MPTAACSNGRVFHMLTGTEAGVADGMKCDQEGNVYCTGPGGIHVMDPNGTLLGRLRFPAMPPTSPGATTIGARST